MSDEHTQPMSRDLQSFDVLHSVVHTDVQTLNSMQEPRASTNEQTDPTTPPVSRANSPPNVKREHALAKRFANKKGSSAQLDF